MVSIASPAAIDGLAAEMKACFPELNVLFHNAGIACMEDYTADRIDAANAVSTVRPKSSASGS